MFVCECGGNISNFVDIENIIKEASSWENVAMSEKRTYLCSKPSVELIKESIRKHDLNRIVLACCTPRMHKKMFERNFEEDGLNSAFIEIANIREQCSWVHPDTPEEATSKATDLVRGLVKKVEKSVPLIPGKMDVKESVLVIGGGIAGITSALRVAEHGTQTYLLEKESSIGGHMIQYPKVFPTLDCSQCILTPKMGDVADDSNINLLTLAEIESVSGWPGDFKVKVRKKARFVDLEKCTSCGDCIEACPVEIKNEFNLDIDTRKAIYRRFPQAVPNAFAIDKKGIAPCRISCPAGVNVQGYVSLISQGKFTEALELIRRSIPFPNVCSRVCFHPCEFECERGKFDEPIAINALKRFAVDYENKEKKEKAKPIPKKHVERVAIVGSGPAGLTAAYELVNRGYPVIVFEALPEPGGMLRFGIPNYRLPKNALDAEIEHIMDLGVEIRTNVTITDINELSDKGYDAIFVAIGAQKSSELGVEGEDLSQAIQALDFLKRVNLGEKMVLGEKITVIGGGNAAIDAARTALRLGYNKVEVLYRRSREEMPAYPSEVEEAEKEGVEISFQTSPTKITGRDGRVSGVECVKMRLGEPDESGRRRPIPIDGSQFTKEVDTVIIAIGQHTDLSPLPEELKFSSRDTIAVDPITLETSIPGVFAGGDAVLGPASVIEAIADGKRAAVSIERYLRGEDIKAGREEELKAIKDVSKEGLERKQRQTMPTLPIEQRARNFREVELGFTEEMAIEEAKRCLACGGCSECLECEKVCEAEAIIHQQKDEYIELEVGAIILATGFELYDISELGEFWYGKHPNVITALQMERLMDITGPTKSAVIRLSDGMEANKVAYVLCAGSRDPGKGVPYCSRVCCLYAIKQALYLRKFIGIEDVCLYYIDIRAPGRRYEEFYKTAQMEGVKFVKGKVSEIIPDGDQLIVRAEDMLVNRLLEDRVDLVVLCPPVVTSSKTLKLSEMLKAPVDEDNFILEHHPKLNPIATKRAGIFACGMVSGPKDIQTTVAESEGAALKAINFLRTSGTIEPNKAFLKNPDICDGCGECVEVCPVEAISLEDGLAKINEIACTGCGACIPACPLDVIDLQGLTEEQLLAQIKGTLDNPDVKTKILAFTESDTVYIAADIAGISRLSYPSSVRIINLPSISRLKLKHILYAFAHGADGVMLLEAPPEVGALGQAHAIAEDRAEKFIFEIEDYGISSARLWFSKIYVPDWRKLKNIFETFEGIVIDEGPIEPKTRSELLKQL